MAWTSPRTWVAAETVTALLLNTHVRDNLNLLKTWIRDDGVHRNVKFAKSDSGSSNSGTGETDLTGFTFTIGASELVAVGDGYVLEGHGSLAAGGNTKTLRLDIAGQKLIILQTTSASSYFYFRLRLCYYSANVVRVSGYVTVAGSSGIVATTSTLQAVSSISSLNFANSQTLKMTGQGGASTEITLLEMTALRTMI